MSKRVSFAPPEVTESKDQTSENYVSNQFDKIPPELQYLEKSKPNPKPLPDQYNATNNLNPSYSFGTPVVHIKNLPTKEVSFANKQSELNFNYDKIKLPISDNRMIVQINFASVNPIDLKIINSYNLNLSGNKGIGREFSGQVYSVGSNISDFAKGDKVVGIYYHPDGKGTLSSHLVINPKVDVIAKIPEPVLNDTINIDLDYEFNGGEFRVEDLEEEEQEETEATETDKSDTKAELKAGSASSVETEENREQETNVTTYDEDESSSIIKKQEKDGKASCADKKKISVSSKKRKEIPALAKFSLFPVAFNMARQCISHSVLSPSSNILIHGGATTIGITLIQLLRSQYNVNEVNTITSVKHNELMRFLGANETFNYNLPYEGQFVKNEQPVSIYKKDETLIKEIAKQIGGDKSKKYDLIVDLIGGTLFTGKNISSPPVLQLLKGKSQSAFVTTVGTKKANYKKDDLNSGGFLSPWAQGSNILSGLSNLTLAYNYYYEPLKPKQSYLNQGLELFCKGELKFNVDEFVQWKEFKRVINKLRNRENDGKIILKVEDF